MGMTRIDPVTPNGVERLRLSGIAWETYDRLLNDVGERPLRLTYDRGELELMTLSRWHELLKCVLSQMLQTLFEELNIPFQHGGSMTFRRIDQQRGLEPDSCYWIASAGRVLGKKARTATARRPSSSTSWGPRTSNGFP